MNSSNELRLVPASIVAAILCFAFSSVASAGESWQSGPLSVIYPFADGNFALMFSTDNSACTSVENPKRYHVIVGANGMTVEGAKKIYATAMAAMSLNKPLSVAFDNSSSSCYVNRVLFSN